MERRKPYSRIEDMSPDGKLTIFMQEDGDVVVEIFGYNLLSSTPRRTQVEFCAHGSGGGRSPHTRKALIALAEAIEKDNSEHPILQKK